MARQRPAKPCTAVRIRYPPLKGSKEPFFLSMPKSGRTHIAINRQGGLFIFFIVGLGAAAIYAGNSGVMLFFCALFAVCVLAIGVARRNLRQISIERRFVEDIFAGRESRIDLLIKNNGKKTVYGLHVYDTFEQNRQIGPVFVKQLPPGETATARYMCQFPGRGIARFRGFQIRSRFPLPFLELRCDMEHTDSAFVYPEPIAGHDMLVLEPADVNKPRYQTKKDDNTIRELVHGKRLGRILWKLSARRQVWMESVPLRRPVRGDKPAIVVLGKEKLGAERFERQISQVTDFALKRMMQNQSGEVHIGHQTIHYGVSPQERRVLLETLAQI